MSERGLQDLAFDQLLAKLEELEDQRGAISRTGAEETRRLIHDLQVHQVELELQNRELRETQSLLEESRARYVVLYDEAPVGYTTLDGAGTITAINMFGAGLLETERARLIGRSFRRFLAPVDRLTFDSHLRRCFTEGVRASSEVALSLPSGRTAVFELVSMPVHDSLGRVGSCHTVVSDVSERRKAEAERAQLLRREKDARSLAENANLVKEDFLAMVSHELRAPLAPMMMWLKVLRKSSDDVNLRARALEVLDICLTSQVKLIDDLVDVARTRTGKLRIDRHPIHLKPLVDAAVAAVEPSAAARQIGLATTYAGASHHPVLGDDARLRQVIGNLLSNAIKFTGPGGSISVHLVENELEVVLTVSDNGEGITPDLLPHIFEPFRQQDATAVRRHEGLGLGLAIVRELVRLHGGTVKGDSPGRNKGATFVVTLPTIQSPWARAELAATVSTTSVPRSANALRGVNILIVEDQVQSRDALVMVLQQYGAAVTAAGSAEAGRTALARTPADVIICDIAMPDEDGHMFVAKLRRQEKEQGGVPIAVVALTAHAAADDRRRALEAGFDVHVAKPVDPDELVSMIATLTDRVRTGGSLAVSPAVDSS